MILFKIAKINNGSGGITIMIPLKERDASGEGGESGNA